MPAGTPHRQNQVEPGVEVSNVVALSCGITSWSQCISDAFPHAVPLHSQAEGDDIKIIFCLFVRYLALLCLPREKKK